LSFEAGLSHPTREFCILNGVMSGNFLFAMVVVRI
jgi:hypothetical protein